MVVMGGQTVHGRFAQPCAQAFAQLLPRSRLLRARIEQLAMRRHERRQLLGHQRQRTHRRGHRRLLQPAARQLEQQRGIAFRRKQPDRHLGRRAPLVFQLQGEPLHAAIAAGQEGGKIRGQPLQREQQRLRGFDFVTELDPHREPVRRAVPGQRQFVLAQQRIQMPQDIRREAPRQPGARQRHDLAQRAQAHALEGGGDVRREAGALHRQLPEGMAHRLDARHRQPVVDIGQCPRRGRVRRGNDAVAEAQLRQLFPQPRLEPRPRPEQAQAALDFDDQRVAVLGADLRTEAVGPGSQEPVPAGLLVRIMFDGRKRTHQRLRRGQ